MTYKEVFQLAQDKGCAMPEYIKYYSLVDLKDTQEHLEKVLPQLQLILLTLIQKWLRDEHEMYVLPNPNNSCSIYWRKADTEIKWFPVLHGEIEGEKESKFSTYEDALLNGINEALKLI